MFKPTVFRFANAVQWPGAGPTTEIHAETVRDTRDEGEQYVFVHASGVAVKVDKGQVTVYGLWTDDNVPNMPTPEQYPDNIPSDAQEDKKDEDTDNMGEVNDAPDEPPAITKEADTDAINKDAPEASESPVEPLIGDDDAGESDASQPLFADETASADTADTDKPDDVSGEELDLLPRFKSKRKKK
jgi:hypothetical protein